MTTTGAVPASPTAVSPALAAGLDIPVVTGVAAQGDVLISPAKVKRARMPMPPEVTVVGGEFGGHPHTLHPEGECFWEEAVGLKLGILTVPRGSSAFLMHPEHGTLEIAPGTYRLARQREFTDRDWQLVAD
ncbi:hypothetical protein [Nocardia transvalensis]|uniref:hypothetical protein n=1 Tax=Nocardia transvalensis TaxID=37333 RepID=UPI0018961B13|nr:hypothetical protein [Nocardia transvalensis]MBF6333566.1 hypothetical protein [Nocardia transvalensis]